MKKKVKVFIGFIFLILFVFLSIKLTLPKIEMAISSIGWEKIEGEVLMNDINSNAGKNKNLSTLSFRYKYVVAGKEYNGTSRYYDFSEPNQNFGLNGLKKFVKDFPIGSKISVHYDSDVPENSTIKKGFLLQHWVLIFVNIIFLMMSLHLIFFPNYWKLGISH